MEPTVSIAQSVKNYDREEYIQNIVDFDKAFSAIKDTSIKNLSNSPLRCNFQGKMVFTHNNTMYKLYSSDQAERVLAFLGLMRDMEIDFFVPCLTRYKGEVVSILIQRRLNEIGEVSDHIAENNGWEKSKGSLRFLQAGHSDTKEEEINRLIYSKRPNDFEKLKKITNIFDLRDLYRKNLGIEDNQVYCIDYDPRPCTSSDLVSLCKEFSLPAENIFDYIPLLKHV